MKLGEAAKKMWKVAGYTGEAMDFIGDVIVGKSILGGETTFKGKKEGGEGEKIPPIERLKARFADIGRGDEAIIARLLGKLHDNDRAVFLGFKMWLAEKDKIKYFILRRHLTYLYEKSETEAMETMLDIVSKLERGGNEATMEYCNSMEITYDSTIALIKSAYDKILLPGGKIIRTRVEGLYTRINNDCAEDGPVGREIIALRQLSENFRNRRRR